MPGEKRFGTSLFGFSKSDVNLYIEKILKEFDDKLKSKDEEINAISGATITSKAVVGAVQAAVDMAAEIAKEGGNLQ